MHKLVTAVTLGLFVVVAAGASAQNLIEGTEELEFDRTESWAMKYFASLSLLTSMGVPESMGAGTIDIGFEGGTVSDLDDEQRRVGFNGTKLENLNRTNFFGRARVHIGLSEHTRLELAYVPPVSVGGVEPNLFAIGVGRPFAISDNVHLGARGYVQFGTLKGDITCADEEAAAGSDPVRNPFNCQAPSEDELSQRVYGGELTAGLATGSVRPYVGLSVNYLDLEFRVNALYSGLDDRTSQLTDGTTVAMTGGVKVFASPRVHLTGELFYSWLSVARPPATEASNDGLLNARFFVTYRIR